MGEIVKIGVNLKDLKKGIQILYVPLHAGNNLNHADCESGFVTSTNEKFAFCRYWSKTYEGELRTMANSEAISPDRIAITNSVPQQVVLEKLIKIQKEQKGYFER